MKEKNKIDDFFKEALSDYVPPAGKPRISSFLWMRLFFLTAFSKVLFAVLFIGLIAGGTLIYQSNFSNSKPTPVDESDTIFDALNDREPENVLSDHFTQSEMPENTTISSEPETPEAFGLEQQPLPTEDVQTSLDVENTEQSRPPASSVSTFDLQKSPIQSFSGKRKSAMSMNLISTIKPRGDHSIEINKSQIRINPIDSLKLSNRSVIHYSLILALQPTFVFNKIENTSTQGSEDDFSEEYRQVILEPGFNISFRMQRHNWILQSGLTYSSYGEDVTYRQNFYTPEYNNQNLQIDTTWGWVYDPPIIGIKWPLSIDSIWTPTYKRITESYEVKNRYHYLEVPVLFGYRSHIRQISYSITTGVGMGFLIQQSGYLPGEGDPVLKPSGEFTFSTPHFNYIFQAGIGIPVKEHVEILIEPLLRYTLNTLVNDPGYNYTHRYLSIGINVGMTIKIK